MGFASAAYNTTSDRPFADRRKWDSKRAQAFSRARGGGLQAVEWPRVAMLSRSSNPLRYVPVNNNTTQQFCSVLFWCAAGASRVVSISLLW
ncbi:hypothetical protein CCM_00686 [Cordyceps militaris CM01]|uniref:Uncharacterized protein n=1 Tax=Cordyceps militaris (strain CM01) TaxID=983644 RepID=G3J5H0_CORMM|nr:uncharacterized protein CCM_00686 [Cordyceps militaris CM01]EGX96031.1 hypothetical protein CCM_00686 [Cordyceps militaris CM01]